MPARPNSICCLTSKLSGRPTRPNRRRECTISPALAPQPLTIHGPLQRKLDGAAFYADLPGEIRRYPLIRSVSVRIPTTHRAARIAARRGECGSCNHDAEITVRSATTKIESTKTPNLISSGEARNLEAFAGELAFTTSLCHLTTKLSGRPTRPVRRCGRILSYCARTAFHFTSHGPLQRKLDANSLRNPGLKFGIYLIQTGRQSREAHRKGGESQAPIRAPKRGPPSRSA